MGASFDEWYAELRRGIKEELDLNESISDPDMQAWIERKVFSDASRGYVPSVEKHRMVNRLFHAFRGLDALQQLVDDPAISEIMVNRHDEIFIERNGEVRKSEVVLESEEKLTDLIQRIVGSVNRTVNESTPIVDARLPDGSRVHVVLPPIALRGPTLTIRKFTERPLALDDLVRLGTLSEEAAEDLACWVKAKYNVFISGGTGSGKTTLLNALAGTIPADERIVTIEDSAELRIGNVPNLVSLETRNANTEGKGAIGIRELIRASLRMRPNRIIVGEVRGSEALDMLQAMNTGHDGSLSTGHANSTADMLSRLETMALSAAPLPLAVIRSQIGSAIELMVHVSRMRDRSRKIVEISEMVGCRDGRYDLRPIYKRELPDGDADDPGGGMLIRTPHALERTRKLRMAGVAGRR